jgi:hypothetical protein
MSRNEFESAIRLCRILDGLPPHERTDELIASIHLARRRFNASNMTPFFRIWKSYFARESESVLQISGELFGANYVDFLCGIALMQMRKWPESLECFERSISQNFRISASLNCAGICAFHLENIKLSVNFFERSVRSVSQFGPSVFNFAEMCGFLGKTYEQQTLLEFYVRTEKVLNQGSLERHIGSRKCR